MNILKLTNRPKNKLVQKVIEVEAMREYSKGILREPRLKRIRLDKTEGDF